MRRWLFALLGLALTTPAAAAAPPPAWQGVWQGTIGTLPVRACFDAETEDGGYTHGSYYYMSHKRPIGLNHEDDGSWSESEGDKETGRWTVAAKGADDLTGEWRSGARRLPIALKRVDYAAEDGACGSDAYMAPRVVPVKVTGKPVSSGGFSYTALTYDVGPNFDDVTIISFSVPETQPGDKAINAALAYDPLKAEGEADFVGCYRNSAGSQGIDGDFDATREPKVVTRDFLVVQESFGGFCGGAHPDYGYYWKVWDRQSGQAVHLPTWLADNAMAERPDKDAGDVWTIAPALRKIAIRHLPPSDDDECKGVFDDVDFWDLGIAKDGFVLTPSLPHVIAACGDDAVIPFAEFMPFLNPTGKAQMARFRAAPAQVMSSQKD